MKIQILLKKCVCDNYKVKKVQLEIRLEKDTAVLFRLLFFIDICEVLAHGDFDAGGRALNRPRGHRIELLKPL